MKERRQRDEFAEFLAIDPASAPAPGPKERAARERIGHALEPAPLAVLGRLGRVHLVSALLTLSVCPQFGFRVLGEGAGLMGWFMHFGAWACQLACGAFFLGASGLLAAAWLSPADVRRLRASRWLYASSLVALSLGAFLMIEPEVVLELSLAAWIAGALAGAGFALELGWLVRRSVRSA